MLRKTEVNLLRLQCTFTEQRYSVCNSNREQFKSPRSEEMQKKLYEEKEPVNSTWNIKQDLEDFKKGFEQVAQSKLKEQQNSLDYYAEKVAEFEENIEDFAKFRVNIEEKIKGVENRCKEKIGEVERFCRNLVTVEELRKAVDEVKVKGIELAKRMQKELDDAKVVGNEEKDRAISEIEGKLEGKMRFLVGKSEFFKDKENLEQRIDDLVRQSEGNIEVTIERMKKGYRKSCKKLENELIECENGINSVIENLSSRLETIEEIVDMSKKQNSDAYRNFKSEIERLETLADTSSLEDRIKLLENKLKAIPRPPQLDLSEFVEQSDLRIWVEKYEKVVKEKKRMELRIDELEQKLLQIETKIQKKGKKRRNNLIITKEFSIEGISTFGKPGFLGSSSIKPDFSFAVQTFSSDILNFSTKPLEKIEEFNIILTPNLSEKQFSEPKNEDFYNLIDLNHEEIKDFPLIEEDIKITTNLHEKLNNEPKNEVLSELIEFNQENEFKNFPVISKKNYGSLSNSSYSEESEQKLNTNIDEIFRPPSKNMNPIKSFEDKKNEFQFKSDLLEIGEKELIDDAFNEFVDDEIVYCYEIVKNNFNPPEGTGKTLKQDVSVSNKKEMNWKNLDSSSSSSEEEDSQSSSIYSELFKKN